MFLVRLRVCVMGNMCFVGGMEMVECREGQMEGGKNSLRRQTHS